MAKVSIIVPVYNVESYLPECVESLLNQTDKDIEILLVDDGSTDGSGNLCDAYCKKDDRVRVIHQENSGQGVARNAGLAAATGEYVLFVDSDDWIEANLVERTYTAAKQYDAEMVIFDLRAVLPDGRLAYQTHEHIWTETVLDVEKHRELLVTNPSPCNKILCRKWLSEQHFQFPAVMYEDLVAMSILMRSVRRAIYLENEILYNYLLRQGSSQHNGNPDKTVKSRLSAIDLIMDCYENLGLREYFRDELAWIATFHGFFLPAREILKFTDKPEKYINTLRRGLDSYCPTPKKNPYYCYLSRREQLMFDVLYHQNYSLLKVLTGVNDRIKGNRKKLSNNIR